MSQSRTITYSSSLLLVQQSEGASNVLAHNTDLGKLGRSTLSDLDNTELLIINEKKLNYLRELLLVGLDLGHELITVLLTKFNSLNSGYHITESKNELTYAFL